MRIQNNIIILLLSLLATACNVDKRDVESPISTPVEVTIRATQGEATRAGVIYDPVIEVGADLASAATVPATALDTRTELGAASDGKLPIHWSWSDEDKRGDRIMVWAKPATDAVGFTFAQTVFSLAYFNYTYSSADFTATVADRMDEDYNYNYYAIYPVPTTVSDDSVTYTLPTTQTGDYDGAYDIMRGSATGAALVKRTGEDTEVWDEPELQMNHLLHLMRIRVPESKNLMNRPIKRLEITFPQAIVGGTVTFNPTDPTVPPTWNGQSKKLTIDFADDNLLNAAGRDVWFFVKPTAINGTISFQAYDTAGVPADEISTTVVNKTLQAEHITPIVLTIPESLHPVTYVKITETANNLGEEWNTMTLSGAKFVKPFTLDTTDWLEVTPETSKVYEVAIAADPLAMQGKSIAASYDSPNAIVSNSIALPATISNRQANVDNQVPYLLFEDFSRIVNEEESYGNNSYNRLDEREQPGKSLSQLPGWNAARFWAKQGTFRFNVRWQMVKILLSFTTTHYGRLDSVPLSALKDNANVKLRVQFDAGANVHSSSTSNEAKQGSYTHISLATHTNSSNPINGVGTGSFESGSLSDFGITHYTSNAMASSYGADDFQNTYPTHTVEIGSATKTTRLCFYPSTTFTSEGIANAEFNVYLDNIKVSIAQ